MESNTSESQDCRGAVHQLSRQLRRVLRLSVRCGVAALLMWAAPASAQGPPPAGVPAPNDYGRDANWLCRPGRHDACEVDLTTTVIAADGSMRKEAFEKAKAPAIDCFYVYPTVSTDLGDYSDMTPDAPELNAVAQQFARFGQVCRQYAPVYRQFTLAGLARRTAAGLFTLDSGLNFDDVRDAWRYYLEHDNNGRGVVLIGHSQGSRILASLIASEIDGRAIQQRLVSAIIPGITVTVAKGRDSGGSFRSIPLCHASADTGCVITFASFRSNVPPPANTRFGHTDAAGMDVACTDPTLLSGSNGNLHAYFDARGRLIFGAPQPRPWTTSSTKVETPFVSVPGLLTSHCRSNEHATYLALDVHGNPADPRTDDIAGDLKAAATGAVQADWGLHLIDMNLAMGNLLDIVQTQAQACADRARAAR
jgi:hypothetical protein